MNAHGARQRPPDPACELVASYASGWWKREARPTALDEKADRAEPRLNVQNDRGPVINRELAVTFRAGEASEENIAQDPGHGRSLRRLFEKLAPNKTTVPGKAVFRKSVLDVLGGVKRRPVLPPICHQAHAGEAQAHHRPSRATSVSVPRVLDCSVPLVRSYSPPPTAVPVTNAVPDVPKPI
jgi:hypothetical protein